MRDLGTKTHVSNTSELGRETYMGWLASERSDVIEGRWQE